MKWMYFNEMKKAGYISKALKYASKYEDGFRRADLYAYLGVLEDGHVWKNYFDKNFEKHFNLIDRMDKTHIKGSVETNSEYFTLNEVSRNELAQKRNTKWMIGLGIAAILVAGLIALLTNVT